MSTIAEIENNFVRKALTVIFAVLCVVLVPLLLFIGWFEYLFEAFDDYCNDCKGFWPEFVETIKFAWNGEKKA